MRLPTSLCLIALNLISLLWEEAKHMASNNTDIGKITAINTIGYSVAVTDKYCCVRFIHFNKLCQLPQQLVHY